MRTIFYKNTTLIFARILGTTKNKSQPRQKNKFSIYEQIFEVYIVNKLAAWRVISFWNSLSNLSNL